MALVRPTFVMAVLVLLGGASAAQAQTAEISQEVFGDDGHPTLVANPSPDGSRGTVSWRICAPDGACRAGPQDRFLEPGSVPPGTTFEATVDDAGERTTDRSRPWLGRVTATAPARLEGRAALGERVEARPATWSGGWGDEHDQLHVVACRTKDGMECEQYRGVLDLERRTVGRYLFAADERTPDDAIFPSIAYPYPRPIPRLEPASTVSVSAPAGPVLATPRATLARRVGRRGARLVVGRATCAPACRLEITVADGRRTIRRTARIFGDEALRLARPGRLDRGRVRIVVRIRGGRVLAAGRRPY